MRDIRRGEEGRRIPKNGMPRATYSSSAPLSLATPNVLGTYVDWSSRAGGHVSCDNVMPLLDCVVGGQFRGFGYFVYVYRE